MWRRVFREPLEVFECFWIAVGAPVGNAVVFSLLRRRPLSFRLSGVPKKKSKVGWNCTSYCVLRKQLHIDCETSILLRGLKLHITEAYLMAKLTRPVIQCGFRFKAIWLINEWHLRAKLCTLRYKQTVFLPRTTKSILFPKKVPEPEYGWTAKFVLTS